MKGDVGRSDSRVGDRGKMHDRFLAAEGRRQGSAIENVSLHEAHVRLLRRPDVDDGDVCLVTEIIHDIAAKTSTAAGDGYFRKLHRDRQFLSGHGEVNSRASASGFQPLQFQVCRWTPCINRWRRLFSVGNRFRIIPSEAEV